MNLEDVIVFPEIPTIIIDCRVLVFRILSQYKKYEDKLKDYQLRNDWIFANWSLIVNDPIPYLKNKPDFNVIIVDDTRFSDNTGGGGYWRNLILPSYKANRDPLNRPDSYFEILDNIYSYIAHSNIPLFKEEGFEADDFAGLAYRNKLDTSSLILYTVDTDWLQLVSDSKNILFCCTSSYKPKLRSEYEVIMWAYNKGFIIRRPEDIVTMKKIYGDTSDNIPEGYGNEDIISLINPFLEPSEENRQKMIRSLNRKETNQNKNHLEKAKIWLSKNDYMS